MKSVIDEKYCLAIIGGHELWREAICTLLSRMMPNAMIFGASDENDPVFSAGNVNLVIFCLSPPYLKGLERLLKLRHRFQAVPLILISDAEDNIAALAMRVRGANGFLRASASIEELWAMISDALSGKLNFPLSNQEFSGEAKLSLTPRQLEVFVLLCQGRTNKEIGSRLCMSDNTVRTHVSAIFDLLGVRNRTEAAVLGRNLIGILLCLAAAIARCQSLALQLV
jgi:two-component system, NarL family, nitrate/nitrite response regulator NarL